MVGIVICCSALSGWILYRTQHDESRSVLEDVVETQLAEVEAVVADLETKSSDESPGHDSLISSRYRENDYAAHFVEVSGSVLFPGIYPATPGARIFHVIEAAGGYNDSADREFVSRNINTARYITNQEKIHIPSRKEVQSGVFQEKDRFLAYLAPAPVEMHNENFDSMSKDRHNNVPIYTPHSYETENGSEYVTDLASTGDNSTSQVPGTPETNQSGSSRGNPDSTNENFSISIQSASSADLERLPGIGPVTAKKIIDGRPYTSVQELLDRNIISEKLFDELRNQFQL